MRYLLFLLRRSRIFFLFLLLEGLALAMIISQRSYQRAVFMNSTQRSVGELLEATDQLTRYLHLREENEVLARQNARLQSLLERAQYFRVARGDTTVDSTHQQRFVSIPARVINSSYSKRNNFLTLDQGSQAGIKKGMGVTGPRGVVGVINRVSPHFASAIPIINPNLNLTGKIANSQYFGVLEWVPKLGHRQLYLADIPRYAQVDSGDVVITDSRSLIFPEGVPVGTVIGKTLQSDQNFLRLTLQMSTDFARLEHVFVIQDKLSRELDTLQP
jgi:rod shape-determining protein MreC